MDFDPGFHEEMYDDDSSEDCEPNEDDLLPEESDDEDYLGSPIILATAAGFGYQMGKDEVDERKLAEDILKRKDSKNIQKVSLKARKVKKGGDVSPARRWMFRVAAGEITTKDPVEYTAEDKRKILDFESETD